MTPPLLNLTSLEKRLREDAERCRAEMEKYQIPHAKTTDAREGS